MPDKQKGITAVFNKPVEKLITYVNIYPVFSSVKALCNVPVKLKALWDTGSTITAIRPETLDRLKAPLLNTVPSKKIAGIGGTLVEAYSTLTNIYLSDNFVIEYCPTYVMEFPKNFDIIIGMDIIRMGDFAVCNTGNTTTLSFMLCPSK